MSRKSVGLLTASVAIGAAWMLLPGCSDEDASLSEVQGTGGGAGSAGATQDASVGGSAGTPTGGSAGTAGSGGPPETGGSAPDAGAGGGAGSGEGGSLPDSGIGGSSQNDAAPDSPPEAGPVVCATTAQCEAQWATDPCKANVSCDGATSTCKFTVLDKDGDGHPPLVCGGDDCDDSKNTVASGLPELCDAVDNNCDGQNNEGAVCPPDAPCPSDGELYDCSGSCGSVYSQCATGACSGAPYYTSIYLAYETDFPAVFRTPSQPGVNPNCAAVCGGGSNPVVYSFGISVHAAPPYFDPGPQAYAVRVKLEPPYRLHHTAYPDETSKCGTIESVSNCALVERIDTVFIFTDDPYAPATNATFELIPWGMGMCK